MLVVKTVVKESPVAGFGLFAAERLSRGTVIWEGTPATVHRMPLEEVAAMCARDQSYVRWHGYLTHGEWHLNVDSSKYINHSPTPNTEDAPDGSDRMVAARDIELDEEITNNYSLYNESFMGFQHPSQLPPPPPGR